MRYSALALTASLATCLFPTTPAFSEIVYDVTIIDPPAGAFMSVPMAINASEEVVGWSLISPAFIKAWHWTAADGMTVLPTPPGQNSRYWAFDINDQGVIAGDGAYDSGVAWTWTPASGFVMVGTLPGFNASRSPRINNLGHIVGELFDQNSALVPVQAFDKPAGGSLARLFPGAGTSSAYDINDAGEIVARVEGVGVLIHADGTQTVLPIIEPYAGVTPARLSESGHVAGIQRCTHECNVPFFYSNEGEMILIPITGTRHSVAGVTSDRMVVGGVTEGVTRGWRWTPQRGRELLETLIDPALNIQIYDAHGVNEAGQIIATGADLDDTLSPRRMMLLTPVGAGGLEGDLDGDGDVDQADLGLLLSCFGAGDCGDVDGDGDTDQADLGALLSNFGQ